ncbi:hypothetical protein HDU96_007565 [Phlyctochytrium bullatum]|nr:hypothetical protein HDU96_007565 [Phlyctochytrium bullatum]
MISESDFLANLLDVIYPTLSSLDQLDASRRASDSAGALTLHQRHAPRPTILDRNDALPLEAPESITEQDARSRILRAVRMIEERLGRFGGDAAGRTSIALNPGAYAVHGAGCNAEAKQSNLEDAALELMERVALLKRRRPDPPNFNLTHLPDVVILQVLAYLSGCEVVFLGRTCQKLFALYRACSPKLWKQCIARDFGYPAAHGGEHFSGGFPERLGTGELSTLDLTHRLDWQSFYEECCGYAVNLRLCGDYIVWISVKTLAVCRTAGPPVRHLEGHTLPLVCLASNGVDLVATAGEELVVRIWDLNRMACCRIFKDLDALDLALCERAVACFTNDDIVGVWDVDTGNQTIRVDLRAASAIPDAGILSREVKVQLSKWFIVCGFEICVWDMRPNHGTLLYRLSEARALQLLGGFPTSTQEVITDFNMESVVAGPYLLATVEDTTGEVYVVQWDFRSFRRAVESSSADGVPPQITSARKYLPTNQHQDQPPPPGRVQSWVGHKYDKYLFSGRERKFEKRKLDDEGGPLIFDYANYWLCYEE